MAPVPAAVPWLLGALALVPAVLRGVRTYKYLLNVDAFGAVMKRQIAAGELERIQKICSLLPETALGPAMSAANGAAMALRKKERPPSEDEIRATLRAAYEPAFDAAIRPLFDGRWMAVVSFVAGAAAVITAMTAGQPEPVVMDDADPRGWPSKLESVLYGFEARSPDSFFEIVAVPFAKEIGAMRTAKLRRDGGRPPRFVVAVFGASEPLRRFRDKVEAEAPARYASCTTPATEIAPDASYGPETRTRTEVLDELRAGKLDVVATA